MKMLRGAPHAWRSPAEAVMVIGAGRPVQHGCIVIVTEGVRPVAYLTVDEIEALDAGSTADLDHQVKAPAAAGSARTE